MKTIEDFKAIWPKHTPFWTKDVAEMLGIPWDTAKEMIQNAETELSVSFFSYGYMFVEPF